MNVSATLIDYLTIFPEIALVALLFIVLGYGSFIKNPDGRTSGIIAAVGTLATLALTCYIAYQNWADITATPAPMFWGDMIAHDPIGVIFRVMFLLALFLTILFSLDTPNLQRPEYFGLLIAATIGFNLMAVSVDMIMILVALETASISLYLLAGFVTADNSSAEAGMKYFVYGAFASALMLYGMSLLYGFTGNTNIYDIAQFLQSGIDHFAPLGDGQLASFNGLVLLAAILLIAGFGFKVSVVPFHWWAPDVYEGAPTPVTGFASTASKAAGFAVFMRVFLSGAVGTVSQTNPWWAALVSICVITMLLGNMLAIYQTSIKRMLAYSSVAQAGYVLIGLVSIGSSPTDGTQLADGAGAAMFYLLMYVVTNLAAFGIIAIIASHNNDSDEMTSFNGLSRRSPWLGLAMMLVLLSLGGIPPTAGFVGKFFIFRAAVNAGFWWLALIGILMAFISLYYYLSVIKYIYLYRDEATENDPIAISGAAKLGLALTMFGILFLGIYAGPAFEWTLNAAQWFFPG